MSRIPVVPENYIRASRLQAAILILRHQFNVLQQHTPRRRLHLHWIDRALFIWLYRRCPRILDAIAIVRPENSRSIPLE
jgi:hypothetical protein